MRKNFARDEIFTSYSISSCLQDYVFANSLVLYFSVCEDCEEVYDGDCPIHGPLRCLDPSAGWDEDSKAYTTVPVPAQLTVKTSDIIDAGE